MNKLVRLSPTLTLTKWNFCQFSRKTLAYYANVQNVAQRVRTEAHTSSQILNKPEKIFLGTNAIV